MRASMLLLVYFSPETLLPATSIVATIAGVVMMLGRGSIRLMIRMLRRGRDRAGRVALTSQPHFPVRDEAHSQVAPD